MNQQIEYTVAGVSSLRTFTPKIGYHKVTVSNLHIISINPNKLPLHSFTYVEDDYAIADDGIPFSAIRIGRTEFFNEFKACGFSNHYNSTWSESVKVTFSPSDPLGLFTLDELKSHIKNIASFLEDSYELTIDYRSAKIRACEIAAEFILPEPLAEFSRAFHILESLNLNASKIDYTRVDAGINKWQSCIFKKPSWEMYVYDKKKELRETKKILIDQNVTKIEIRLPETYAYKIFKGTLFDDIEKDQHVKYFMRCFHSVIENPYKNWEKTYMKNLDSLVTEYRSTYKFWCTELLLRCESDEAKQIIRLLDYQDILECPCIKNLPRNQQYRIKQHLTAKAIDTSFQKNTKDKIHSIFSVFIHNNLAR